MEVEERCANHDWVSTVATPAVAVRLQPRPWIKKVGQRDTTRRPMPVVHPHRNLPTSRTFPNWVLPTNRDRIICHRVKVANTLDSGRRVVVDRVTVQAVAVAANL